MIQMPNKTEEEVAAALARAKENSQVTLIGKKPRPKPRTPPVTRTETREVTIGHGKKSRSYREQYVPLEDAMSRAVRIWCLRNEIRTKEDVKNAIKSGRLHYTCVTGLGRKGYIGLCVALDILPVNIDNKQTHAQAIEGAIRLLTENGYIVTKSE
jgi:hypothetical protein